MKNQVLFSSKDIDKKLKCLLLLLCSHSPNNAPPEPQWNVSIAAIRGGPVRPSKSRRPLPFLFGALRASRIFVINNRFNIH